MMTAKEYLASHGRRKLTPDEAAKLYRLRDRDVWALARKPVITITDIHSLEWGGRFKIANDYLDKCDDTAREALLHDPHHGVRSAAALFNPVENDTRTKPLPRTSVADTALAIMNGQERIDTLNGVKSRAGIEAMILSTHPLDALERAEHFIAGFEDDEQQEGVDELLAVMRGAINQIR